MNPSFVTPDDLRPDVFPGLRSFPTGMIYTFLPVPKAPAPPPEYVFVPTPDRMFGNDEDTRYHLAVQDWNLAWETAQLRPEFFSRELPKKLRWLRKYRERDITLVPLRGSSRLAAYTLLYHLLPLHALERFGIPALGRGGWPLGSVQTADHLGAGIETKLTRAFAHHVWPLLCPGSSLAAFATDESIRLLAHNLDYWFPHADQVVRRRVREFPRPPVEAKHRARFEKLKADVPDHIATIVPRYGGDVWSGEAEAWEATQEVVELADRDGRLRAIIDAIRSHRVQDDFSHRWSYAKEDFERKLYRKRSKVKVTFVEIDDTIPVHGPQTEVDESLLWEDLFAVLNEKERRIVVCLRSGYSGATEISKQLGYANHSPVSKALASIRAKAVRLLHGES